MTLLPIVERELRIASRRRFTFWGRLIAAGFALLVFAALQIISETTNSLGFKAGQVQFTILKWISFLFACSAGIFLTADSLSEEKREGTLGLLFLTDLKGYDVVFGKLISHSVQAFYGLLAAFPILGLTILAGGVAGAEFGRSMLIICNTVFLSLGMGLFVSSISRDVMKAINGALLLSLFVLVGLPFIDWCLAGWESANFKPLLCNASPGYLFIVTGPYAGMSKFWPSIGIQHGMAWGFLILSSICAPRAWQEKSRQTSTTRTSFSQRWRFGGANFRRRLRQRLLERDPLLWLASRDRWLLRFVWGVLLLFLAALGAAMLYHLSWGPLRTADFFQYVIGLGLLLWVASHASRFFVDVIRTGAVELILVAPVGPERLIRSEWRVLCRSFLMPALLLILMHEAAQINFYFQIMNQKFAASQSAFYNNYAINQLIGSVVGIIKLGGNLAAVAWFGMWMGVTNRKVSIAVFKTLCLVIVGPALVLLFVRGMTMAALAYGGAPFWISTPIDGILNLAKNIFFIVWARKKLFTGFRAAILGEGRIFPTAFSPAVPPVAQPPPIPDSGGGTA